MPQICAQAAGLASIPDEIKDKIKAYGKGLLSTWAPQQLILDHPVSHRSGEPPLSASAALTLLSGDGVVRDARRSRQRPRESLRRCPAVRRFHASVSMAVHRTIPDHRAESSGRLQGISLLMRRI